jgi:hypothetical protein
MMDDYYYQAKAYQAQLLCEAEKIRLLRAIRASRISHYTLPLGSTKLGTFFRKLLATKPTPRPVVVQACKASAFCSSGTVGC